MMTGPSRDFLPGRPGRMAVTVAIYSILLSGICTESGRAQSVLDQDQICNFISCIGWCECTGQPVDVSDISSAVLFCPVIQGFNAYDTCADDPETAVVGRTRNSNFKNCEWDRTNPLIFFKNDTDPSGTGYALKVWEGSNPAEAYLLREYCVGQCNTVCNIIPPTTTPAMPTTTPFVTGNKIDDIIPRRPPTPTGVPVLSSGAIIGIAVGVFLILLIVGIIVIIYCHRSRRQRGPKLPPRRSGDHQRIRNNTEYATIDEMQMMQMQMRINGHPNPSAPGRSYPNVLYRSESMSALNSTNQTDTLHRSTSELDLLGDPPHPPVRQTSLLPGLNPALADGTDGNTAPLDAYGYTKYLPDGPSPSQPYMHLKATPTLSDPAYSSRIPQKPHRYRSNTGDITHADAQDVDRMVEKIRSREALKNGGNRRFVPNQSSRARSSTLTDDYNLLNRSGRRAAPRQKKQDGFTSVPVHAHYQSKPRRSPENIRRWRSLPDMTDGTHGPVAKQAVNTDSGDECPPVYHLLEASPASTIADYTKRDTVHMNNGSVKSRDSAKRRAASESTYQGLGKSNTSIDRYDPVYEPGIPIDGEMTSNSAGVYQPLSFHAPGQDDTDFDDGAYQGPEELLDRDAYLKPKKSARSSVGNGVVNGQGNSVTSPTKRLSNGDYPTHDSMKHKPYIYNGDNNNSPDSKHPSRMSGGSSYAPLRLKPADDHLDVDDEMENGEYMYHPAGDLTA